MTICKYSDIFYLVLFKINSLNCFTPKNSCSMCSPLVFLNERKVKAIKKWSSLLLNDVEKKFKDEIGNRKSKFIKDRETEYKYVSIGVYRGMQTYCAEIPGTEFKKFGPNCRILAKEVDKFLVINLRQPPVNDLFKPLVKTA